MPILDIEIVGPISNRDQLAQRLADAAGKALRSRSNGTWIKLRFLDRANYAENEGACEVRPVFVQLVQANPPRGKELEEQIVTLTRAIATEVGRAIEHVHIILEPPARGRISFGGKLQK